MYVFDVNIYVNAFRVELPHHACCRDVLSKALNGTAQFGISELALSGFVRIVTTRRIFKIANSSDEAFEFCATMQSAPNARVIRPQAQHWQLFSELCCRLDARDKLVADVYHAALAIEQGLTWVSLDRDFAKFPRLKWFNPLSE